MCVGCGEMKPKAELVRIVKKSLEDDKTVETKTEETKTENTKYDISVDLVGKKPGRGAYICRDTQCLAKARKSKRLENAFKCSIADKVYETLEKEMCADG